MAHKIDYRNFALTNQDPALDRMGWDMVAEAVSETVETIEDARDTWRHYQTTMYARYAEGKIEEARFYAWAMIYVENYVAARWGR